MKGLIFVVALTAYLCIAGLLHPWIGAIGYFGYVVLCPGWQWWWAIFDNSYQKYIAIATIIGFLLNFGQGNRLRGAALWSTIAIILHLALCFIATTQSIDFERSWYYTNNIWKVVLMGVIAVIVLDQPFKIVACMWAIVLAQGFNAYRINDIYFERGFIHVYYFNWNFLDNNTYSLSTLPVIGFTAALALYSRKRWQQALAWLIFVLQMHVLMLLQSRGCMLAAMFQGVMIVLLMPKNWYTIGCVVLILIAGGFLAGEQVIEEFTSSFKPIEEMDASGYSRIMLWKAGYRMTLDYPLLGVGPWAGQNLVPQYYGGHLEMSRKGLHNQFFEVSTGMGLPATFLLLGYYFIVWFALAWVWIRRRRELPVWAKMSITGTLVGIAGFWAGSMFSSGGLIESPYVCVAIGAATLCVLRAYERRPAPMPVPLSRSAHPPFAAPVPLQAT